MKHIVYTILFAILAAQAFSQDVDEKTARIVSGNFFDNTFSNWKGAPSTPIKNTFLRMYKNHNSTYVVNFLNGGWVILAANKSVGPVLMYSDEGEIEQNIEYPSAFNEWLSLYDEVIDSVYKNKIYIKEKQLKWKQYEENIFERQKPTSNILKSTFYSDGFYLLDSRWGQSWANYGNFSVPAYNVMMGYGGCNNPDGNYTGNYLAGCTAVAMGQILKYWEFSYGPYTDFDWWNMPNSLNTASTNFNTERYAISTMLENIGERINADYGCDGTSALPVFSAKAAFKAVDM
ncbi:MAG: Spi family protease inhibitor [Bacteroidales bacterium]|nr:Spi family protease inhibitor [Bacteroidales bacterium]